MSKTTDHTILVPARAKLNLFLHVGARREDGYHALHSLVVFTDLGDDLQFRASEDLTLTIEGPFASDLSSEDPKTNLVLKAASALADWAKGTRGCRTRCGHHLAQKIARGLRNWWRIRRCCRRVAGLV